MSTESAEKQENALWETIKVLVQALALAVFVRTLLFQPFTIPSGSMIPTLLIGDYLFVSKFSYGYSKYSVPFSPNLFKGRIWEGQPERGDIAVFRLPNDPEVDYIKRVIGLPGDKIQMKDGILFINGEAVKREQKGKYKPDDKFSGGDTVPIYVETLPNGVSYNTLDLNPNSSADNTKVFEVPTGHYFMMGDNRDNSNDSRLDVGFVPFENFIGKASIIFFSTANNARAWEFWNWPTSLRTSRFFKGL